MSKKALNATQLAAAIGKTRQTVHNWVSQGLPRRQDGLFDLPAVIDWIVQRELDNLADQNMSGSGDSPALERYRTARAAMAELDLKTKKGELISHDEVCRQWALRVAEVATGLENFANSLPPLLEGKTKDQMTKIIADRVWDLRDQYARSGKYCPPPSGKPWPASE